MFVTSSGRSSTRRTTISDDGLLRAIASASFWRMIVFPARGGETISARCPRPSGRGLEEQPLVGEGGGQVLERHAVAQARRVLVVHLVDAHEDGRPLAAARGRRLTGDPVAREEPERGDESGRDHRVVGGRRVGGLGRAQEPEPVGEDLQEPLDVDRRRGPWDLAGLEQAVEEVRSPLACRGRRDAGAPGECRQLVVGERGEGRHVEVASLDGSEHFLGRRARRRRGRRLVPVVVVDRLEVVLLGERRDRGRLGLGVVRGRVLASGHGGRRGGGEEG
jgi:hypothetical protein